MNIRFKKVFSLFWPFVIITIVCQIAFLCYLFLRYGFPIHIVFTGAEAIIYQFISFLSDIPLALLLLEVVYTLYGWWHESRDN
jgi:hypothetical protein